MKLSNEQINSIAQDLDCGLICFIHKETKEVTSIFNPDDPFTDEEAWEETWGAAYKEVQDNRDNYVKIEKLSSSESFNIMADFAEQVSNERLQSRLFSALDKRKPFRHFREIVDNHEPTRQAWFAFKTTKFEEYIEQCLSMEDEDYDDDEYEEEDENEAPQINGFFNDDGTPFNPNLHPLPSLCLSCKKKEDPNEEILCNLTRMDQVGEKEFKCFAYEQIGK